MLRASGDELRTCILLYYKYVAGAPWEKSTHVGEANLATVDLSSPLVKRWTAHWSFEFKQKKIKKLRLVTPVGAFLAQLARAGERGRRLKNRALSGELHAVATALGMATGLCRAAKA